MSNRTSVSLFVLPTHRDTVESILEGNDELPEIILSRTDEGGVLLEELLINEVAEGQLSSVETIIAKSIPFDLYVHPSCDIVPYKFCFRIDLDGSHLKMKLPYLGSATLDIHDVVKAKNDGDLELFLMKQLFAAELVDWKNQLSLLVGSGVEPKLLNQKQL
ncbi:hypothetical protein AB4455_06530 [Vibrio sp. 10N.261.46.E12]|uniref:hypothetical protein n=1 Tax=unclassified Vibrio TaxID=2614977 RepID=UPI0009765370|nr:MULTISPECIES: hypothetical protein [unclassified Vibrio]OMO37184.1 hypothetical protein BH584_23750 [Vibrio sp. 10N.261.45.E1]PMJ25783.1 hypothetical protein BCU27_09985 [Vibrio sp. 10N.286.45.B6]PML84422.1 hypothetical protein BCT66_17405 [Vibrio sp. 10N.261.49.E11]PMM90190.1 hypothetical protein BCT46_23780 [Vibrio sp. 10N.261.46.E8]PMN46153.1 hypothetical protein BCT32_11200 [Vibrio sp. 10N.261.45.E11]